MAKSRSFAKFTEMRVIWDLWEGSLPMRRTENQRDVNNNVLLIALKYGEYTSVYCGVDSYYFQEDDRGYKMVVWTDPAQPWAVPGRVGTQLIFSKTSDEHFGTVLTAVPTGLIGVHEGIMIPDNDWDTVAAPGRIKESLRD